MFKNNKYNFTAFGLYMAFFAHGMQAIILSQNAQYLSLRWSTDIAGILNIIAWTGWGKIIFQLFSGILADKFRRKHVVLGGLVGYMILFEGLIFAPNITTANILSFVGGAATSLFDGSINPAQMEIFPNHRSIAAILNKGFISVSGITYPLLVGYVNSSGMNPVVLIWYPFILSCIVFLAMLVMPFPDNDIKKAENVSASEAVKILESRQATGSTTGKTVVNKPTMLDYGLIVAFSFFIYSAFYLFQQVSALYASEVVGLEGVAANSITTWYQVGSFAAVILSSMIMARGVKDITLLVIYPLIAAVGALMIYFVPGQLTLTIGAILVGYGAAGGALQMGSALLNQFFNMNKGRNSSIYFLSMSIGSVLMPMIAAYLKEVDFTKVMLLDAGVAIVALVIMLIMANRYSYVFNEKAFGKKN